ncbi:MAG: O-antigen ligase family protein [Pyrinomonadaceae bacterium]
MSSQVLIERSAPRRPTKIWPLALVPLSGFIAWAVNTGGEGWRWLFLGGMAWSMALALLSSLEAGLVAMMLFEPLRGFLRRIQYLFLPYSQTDPIHLVTPLITLLALAMVLQKRGLRMFTQTSLAKLVSVLGLIYFLQIFNPLQGGLAVGLSGALFILVPVAWFYFGQTITPDFMRLALRLMVVLGIITSLWGLYHLAYGFPGFEQYWLDHTDAYESIQVGKIKRALATYSSAEEWGRYIELGAIIAFGFAAGAINRVRRTGWFLCGGALAVMLMLTGQRTAIFGLILGVIVLLTLGAQTWRAALGRLLLALAPVLLIGMLVNAPSSDDMQSLDEEQRFGAVLSHSTRGALSPTQEGSLQERFTTWSYLATEVIPHNPLGMGLGATSLSVQRSDKGAALPPVDSYFISTAVTCSLAAALLFIGILARAGFMSWRAFQRADRGSPEGQVWRVVAALMPVLILNSIFGNTFTLYSVAPVGWLVVGWISAQQLRNMEARSSVQN